jgi:hypothetical protein
MIDKLEVRVPEQVRFTREFEFLFGCVAVRPARHYKTVADLRPFSTDAILHYSCRHGTEHNHKLELVDTGKMTLLEMKQDIRKIFQVNPDELFIMRLDLAVDVEGVGVPWFAEHTRVRYKRWLAKLGVIDTTEMGNRAIQTLYYGKRPNVIRIYNKVEEYRTQYQRILRRVPPGITPATFEEQFGVPEFGHILTRVERQMGGGRIPNALATVGYLQYCADFNPFDGIEFISGGRAEPDPRDYTFMEYSTGMHLRHLAESEGMQAAMSYITRHSKRNKKWALKKFGDFLPVPSKEDLTAARLFELFQRSVTAQFQTDKTA